MKTENKIVGQPAGFKKIYSGIIPDGWKLLMLSEKAEIEYGISDAIDTTLVDGMKILSLPNVNKYGDFILNEIPLINRKNVKEKDILQEGDLLFNWRNGSKEHLAKTAYFNLSGEWTHVGFLLRIRTNHAELNPLYLKAYINFLRNNGFFLGAKIQVNNTFNKEELGELPLMYPEKKEQNAIANILVNWDDAVSKLTGIISRKGFEKKWLVQQLLSGKKRLKGFEKKKWITQKISSIANEISIKNKEDKNLVVLSCTKYDGLVPSLEYFGRKIYSDDLTTYKIVPRAHFAYATNHIEEGSIGYQTKLDLALISPMYTVFKTNGSIDDIYLYRVLKSEFYIHEYRKRMEGSIDRRGGLRWEEFSKIIVPVPSMEEQNAISNFFFVVDREIALLQNKLDLVKKQKKGLMQLLLTGKKRVKI